MPAGIRKYEADRRENAMPQKKHDFTKTEILAGILVILSGFVLAGFIAIIEGWRPPEEVEKYYACFTSTIGLNTGAEVRFGGVLAGRVTDIQPDPENQTLIRVEASLKPGTPVNAGSVASVEQISLTSSQHLEISTGEADAARLGPGAVMETISRGYGMIDMPDTDGLIADVRALLGVREAQQTEAQGGEEMASVTKLTSDLRAFLGVVEALEKEESGEEEMASVTRLSGDLRRFLGVPEAMEKEEAGDGEMIVITDLTADLDTFVTELQPQIEKMFADLEAVPASVQKILDQINGLLEDNRPALEAIIGDVAALTGRLEAELEGLLESIETILANTDGMTANLNDFLDDNRPALEDVVFELRETLRNARELTRTLSEQPQSLLRGKAPEGRKE
jgi:phospholipid/cholesterol/gamma-HCH transport system substrate-binding protein